MDFHQNATRGGNFGHESTSVATDCSKYLVLASACPYRRHNRIVSRHIEVKITMQAPSQKRKIQGKRMHLHRNNVQSMVKMHFISLGMPGKLADGGISYLSII